jgi:hypothetical protein
MANLEIVDIVCKSWNHLHIWMFEGSEAILGLNYGSNSPIRHT